MSGYIGSLGTYRGTAQQMLSTGIGIGTGTPASCKPTRVFGIDFTVTSTSTPSKAVMVLANCMNRAGKIVNTVTNTATSSSTAFIAAMMDGGLPTGFGSWSSHEGVVFPNGVFIQTATSMGFYTIRYAVVS